MTQLSTVERAFELARDGTCRVLTDLRRRLVHEGYANVENHLSGGSIKKQLTALMKQKA